MTITSMEAEGGTNVISENEEKFNDSLGPNPWDAFVIVDPTKQKWWQRIASGRGWNQIDYLLEEEKKHREIIQNRLEHERQDNAYQRKAADLGLAGLSQTLAPGGSGSPTSQANKPSAPSAGDKRMANMSQKVAMMQGIANVAKTAAETASTAGAMGGVRAATKMAQLSYGIAEETRKWSVLKIEREAGLLNAQVRRTMNESDAKEYDAAVGRIMEQYLSDDRRGLEGTLGNTAREKYLAELAIHREAKRMAELGMTDAQILEKMQEKDWVSSWQPGNLMRNAAGMESTMGIILNIAETLGLNVAAVKKALGF